MNRYIVLLKAVNVGGHNKLLMNDLRTSLTKAGFTNVQTYIQSGNIILESELLKIAVREEVSKLICEQHKLEVQNVTLLAQELDDILTNSPFISGINSNLEELYCTLLQDIPEEEAVANLSSLDTAPDQFIINKNCAYLKLSNPYHKTKINNQFFEKKLNLFATTRNWKTLLKLQEMASK